MQRFSQQKKNSTADAAGGAPTGEIGAVPLFKDAVCNLLAGGRLVDVAVEPPERVRLDDPSDQLTRLTWKVRLQEAKLQLHLRPTGSLHRHTHTLS